MIEEIKKLKKKLNIVIASHFYQKEEIFNLADLTGDSLALAKKSANIKQPLIFCGVKFMGESAKILNPEIDVYMPKLADCSMARMAQENLVKENIKELKQNNIDFIPITYINSTAKTKAIIAKEGGLTCTSSNAEKIIKWAIKQNKKIFFLPDKNLGTNIANKLGLSSKVIGEENWQMADVICFNGHCSVHQLFMPEHIDFYRERIPNIKIALHPECSPEVVKKADFAGSTSQILEYVKENRDKKIAIGTEINFINWIKKNINPNVYVLSSTKPECPSMNETTLKDLYQLLKAIDEGKGYNKIEVEKEVAENAKIALNRMMELS
jgi:quinolinate synthase